MANDFVYAATSYAKIIISGSHGDGIFINVRIMYPTQRQTD